MLEIIFIITFSRKLAEIAGSKGRSKGWAALGALMWFGGEIMGFVIGTLLGIEGLGSYGVALLCGAIGATVAWAVVKQLPEAVPA